MMETKAEGQGGAADCLNCGTPVHGRHCHECGQAAHVHRSLSAFFHDLLHGVLHFEGKMWRTLPLLAWKPGELTRRYAQGERARFVSPLALFLFSVFLMFAVVSAMGGPLDVGGGRPARDQAKAVQEYRQERAESEAELKELIQELGRMKAAGKPTEEIQRRVDGLRLKMNLQRDAFQVTTRLGNQEEAREAGDSAAEEEESAKAPDLKIMGGGEGNQPSNMAWFNKAYAKAKKNPSLLFYKLQTNAYKFSWLLIPISVPFVWVLFLHRRRYRQQYGAYDHVVFVTYSIAFMSLGFIALTLLRPFGFGGGLVGAAMLLAPPIHMYRQLRGAYQLSRFSSLWRTAALIFFSVIAAALFMFLLLVLGVLG